MTVMAYAKLATIKRQYKVGMMTDQAQEKSVAKPVETIAEKRAKKIAQLKAKLQKEESLQKASSRKERNGQLVALGVFLEIIYKTWDEESRKKCRNDAKTKLKDRNLKRVLAAFTRLDGEG